MTMKSKSQRKPLQYYMDLLYEIEIQKAQEGGFVVNIPALPGCIAQVEKWEEVEGTIEDVRREWIRMAYEDGVEIPLPKSEKEYSGKFVLRIPRSLHRNLDKTAESEGVSLNTLIVSIISQSLGSRSVEIAPADADSGSDTWVNEWETLWSKPPREPDEPRLPSRLHVESKRL